MTSTSIISLVLIILSVVFLDVFCGDITNNRQTGVWSNDRISSQKPPPGTVPNSKSTTPWPALGQRWTERTSAISKGPITTPIPKKWIQQNNIWIKNEQAAAGGNSPARGGNQQTIGPLRPNQIGPTQGLSTNQQKLVPVNNNNHNQRTSSNLQPNLNTQQVLLNGLRGNEQNINVGSSGFSQNTHKFVSTSPPTNLFQTAGSKSTPAPTGKPMSYAGAVAPKVTTSPPAVLLVGPITPSPKGSPMRGTSNIASTGPAEDESEWGNQKADGTAAVATDQSSVTDDELRDFSEMLLRKDVNNAMKYVTLNLQGMTTSRSTNDEAPQPLLKIDAAAYRIPSIEKLMLLYNNYLLDVGQNEVYTAQERIEETNLLDAVLSTSVMQFTRSFLIQKDKIGRDPKEFKDLLRQIWFNMYSRGKGRIGSSGFEHVFLAEIKNNQVSGLHNWLYFNEEEMQRRANYLGYMRKIDLGEKGAIVKYHFKFHDIDKPVGSMFVGTSPELEMALYSACFVLRADRICPLKMNGNRFIIRTYTFRYRSKNMIGSAFPEI